MAFELNIKWNKLIKGFPGLLNTIQTLLARSQTIKINFQKISKHEGSHEPRKPWTQNHKIIKIIKNHENHCFFLNMEKMRIEILRREHWTRAPDHWYGHFGSKKCFWKFVKKKNYQIWINFGYIPDGPKKFQKWWKFGKFWIRAVCLTTGYGRRLDSSNPLC